jgi:hypothetical protein
MKNTLILLTALILAILLFSPTAMARTPDHLWSEGFGNANVQRGSSTTTDASGNVIVAGYFAGNANFGGGTLTSAGAFDIFVVKFDANGNHIWSQRFGNATDQWSVAVAADASGNVIVTGYFTGTVDFGGGTLTSEGGYDIFVAKFDMNGGHVWSDRFGDASDDVARSVAIDPTGNIFVTGYFAGNVNFGGGLLASSGLNDICVVKFGGSGSHVWSDRFGDASDQQGMSAATDASENVIVTGHFENTVNFGGGTLSSGGGYDIFVAKFDKDGSHTWSDGFGGTGDQLSRCVATDVSDDVIVTGHFEGNVDFGGGVLTSAGLDDIFIAKFARGGSHVWSRRFGDASDQLSRCVDTDGSGNIIVTGWFRGNVNFGGGILASAGLDDIFIIKFGRLGKHLWSRRFGDASGQRAHCVAIGGRRGIIVTGWFEGTVNFGGGGLACAGMHDIFVVKFLSAPPRGGKKDRFIEEVASLPESKIPLALYPNYPNPFNPSTVIPFALPKEMHVNLSIFDVQGKLIRTLVDEALPGGFKEYRWDGTDAAGNPVSSGIYFYRLKAGQQAFKDRMVLLK